MKIQFPVHVIIEADSLEECLMALWQRLGFDRSWDWPEIYAEELFPTSVPGSLGEPIQVHPEELRRAVVDVTDALNARDPGACTREPCCRGLLRFGDHPICQLNEAEAADLAVLQAELADAAEAEND